jgi:hypothetical protein
VGVRETAPDLLEDWRRHEKSLLQKIAYRERELLELHDEFIELQAKYQRAKKLAFALTARRMHELANAEAKAAREIDI